MEKNNGKIAIAIVAMFVVALSIVGVTYAYFTAAIQGNQSTDNSVEVVAGKLAVRYASTKSIVANNIVPGWESDNDYYYDPVHSIQNVAEIGENGQPTGNTIKGIVAVKASEYEETVTPEDYGKTEPIEFSVTNEGTDTANYAINLVNITNDLAEGDQANFTVTLYESADNTFEEAEIKLNAVKLNATDVDQTLLASTSVSPTDTVKYYRIVLKYADNGNQNASASTTDVTKSVQATVEVEGLGQTDIAE